MGDAMLARRLFIFHLDRYFFGTAQKLVLGEPIRHRTETRPFGIAQRPLTRLVPRELLGFHATALALAEGEKANAVATIYISTTWQQTSYPLTAQVITYIFIVKQS